MLAPDENIADWGVLVAMVPDGKKTEEVLFFFSFVILMKFKNFINVLNNVNKKRFWEVWEMLLICLHMQLIYKYIFQLFEKANNLVNFVFSFFKIIVS